MLQWAMWMCFADLRATVPRTPSGWCCCGFCTGAVCQIKKCHPSLQSLLIIIRGRLILWNIFLVSVDVIFFLFLLLWYIALIFFNLKITFIHLCVCVLVHGNPRTQESVFFPSTMWVLGFKLWSSVLVAKFLPVEPSSWPNIFLRKAFTTMNFPFMHWISCIL